MSLTPVYVYICEYLQSEGLGNIGDDIFGGEFGDPDCQILVLSGDGSPATIKRQYLNVNIQIIVRGKPREPDLKVYAKAKQVYDLLINASDNLEINGACFTGFEPITNLASLGKDENERFLYSMNFSTYTNP